MSTSAPWSFIILKNVHSEADSAILLPKERVLFTAASVGVKRFGNHGPFASIPDTLSAIKMMKALNRKSSSPDTAIRARQKSSMTWKTTTAN